MLKNMAIEIRGDSVIRRAEGWLSAWVGEELVMMSADTGTCISLSPTGGRTWELLETPRQLDSLVDELVHEYGATDDEVRTDVLTFLERLQKEGGITVGESTAA
ncbi:PqqD family protein [Terriglobus roseus]|uniref:Coenzyme PQQ synthesis protein D (PqqD) n=1 Tax=Terriglobus roseus TaxID=392734 RepID=A0A1G7H0L8_9BACT|nr:PqqD family protein [Terriglobus roseus]SDE93957.1 Coenzyme PQQ synthesis protein D (PqqD) [Terriglobus roseus]